MTDTKLEPYLFFRGNCRDAMQFYKNAFGGDLKISTVGEAPAGSMPNQEQHKNDVMHSHLTGGMVSLLASDSEHASAETKKVELCISGKDEQQLRGAFDKLAQGCKVKMKLEKQFWGDTFGRLTDKFGVDWMFNINAR
jgi:PhnB protein